MPGQGLTPRRPAFSAFNGRDSNPHPRISLGGGYGPLLRFPGCLFLDLELGYMLAGMTNALPTPLIGVTSCLKPRDEIYFHSVGEKYVDAVVAGAAGIPVLIPAIGDRLDPEELLRRIDGLLVTGSPSNVDPAHYGGPPPRDGVPVRAHPHARGP